MNMYPIILTYSSNYIHLPYIFTLSSWPIVISIFFLIMFTINTVISSKNQYQSRISKGEGGNDNPKLGNVNRFRSENRMTGILKWHWEDICLVSCLQGCCLEMHSRIFKDYRFSCSSADCYQVTSEGNFSLLVLWYIRLWLCLTAIDFHDEPS